MVLVVEESLLRSRLVINCAIRLVLSWLLIVAVCVWRNISLDSHTLHIDVVVENLRCLNSGLNWTISVACVVTQGTFMSSMSSVAELSEALGYSGCCL